MPETPITLLQGENHGIETDYRDLLPVNMYPVMKEVLGAQGYMMAYSGLDLFATGNGIDRGGFYNDREAEHFRVSGTKFISVSTSGKVTNLGNIAGTGQASMPYSFNTQAIIVNLRMFLYDSSGGFREVTDTDLGDPIDGIWVNSVYFLTDGEYIYHTDVADEESIDPLKFATAEFMPDKSLGISKTQDNKVMVWGRYTVEYFIDIRADVPDTNFGFQRVENRAQKIGIVSTHAKTEISDTWFIVGGRKDESVSVHAVSVGGAQKIATREVDKILEQYTEPELSDIRVESRTEKGTTFVIFNLPNETLCFMPTMGSWIVLKTGLDDNAIYRGINGIFDARIGKWVYGDRFNGNLGLLDDTIFTQYDSNPQEWILYSPLLKLESQSIDSVEIETIPGFNDEGDASVFISLTYNAVTYGTEIIADYGSAGDYAQRFIKRRLGYVSDNVGFKFRGATRSKMAFGLFRIKHA